ncbi:MAG: universal stress protein [Acidobacteriota bacterium]|nr:MAG: universal stress protein [Acidobacteriota bacterium]
MKVLIAYDGSDCSEAAIDDLRAAGLPPTGEAVVVSVAEVWLPPKNGEDTVLDPYLESLLAEMRQKSEDALREAEQMAERGRERVSVALPGWNVRSEATYGSPAWEILNKAEALDTDLIVIGSHGYGLVNRFLLGSISQKVMTEARCSVRVARGKVEVEPAPIRIAVGFDMSQGAERCIESIAARTWPEGTEVRLVAVVDPVFPTPIGRFVPAARQAAEQINENERKLIEDVAARATDKLKAAGVSSELVILTGNPKSRIVDDAEYWRADTIFVGANAYGSRFERFIMGSTSAAVAARASCTVEVVRAK